MITTSLNFTQLDPGTFKSMQEDRHGVILDVRTPPEFAESHISLSMNIDYYSTDFEKQLDDLDKDLPYFIYCATGSRTKVVMDIMRVHNFKEVYDLKGGMLAWEIAGL